MQRAVRDVGFAHIRHRAERAEEIRQVREEAERAGLPSGAALGRDLDQAPVRSLYGVGGCDRGVRGAASGLFNSTAMSSG